MDVTRRNLQVFEAGIKKALQLAKPNLLERGLKIAESLVRDAVNSYKETEKNLTGNLLNSIAGGVYINGIFSGLITASKVGVEAETHTYANVGSKGFKEWGTGDELYGGFVHQYREGFSFQPTEKGGTGRESAINFLSNHQPQSKVFEIVICAAAPYAEYLQNTRKLDVLTTAFKESEGTWNTYIVNVRKIKL